MYWTVVRTGGSSRGDNGAVQTSLGDNVDLDGGVTTRVVDVAAVNLGDRHFAGLEGRISQSDAFTRSSGFLELGAKKVNIAAWRPHDARQARCSEEWDSGD